MSEEALNKEEEITTDSFFGVKHDLVTDSKNNEEVEVEVEVIEEDSNLPDPADVKVKTEESTEGGKKRYLPYIHENYHQDHLYLQLV